MYKAKSEKLPKFPIALSGKLPECSKFLQPPTTPSPSLWPPCINRLNNTLRASFFQCRTHSLFYAILKPWPNDANIYPNKCQHCWALLDIVGCGVAKRTQHLYPTFICLSQQHQQQQQHRISYSTLRSRIRVPPPPPPAYLF